MDSLLPPVGTTYASFNRFKLDMFERGLQHSTNVLVRGSTPGVRSQICCNIVDSSGRYCAFEAATELVDDVVTVVRLVSTHTCSKEEREDKKETARDKLKEKIRKVKAQIERLDTNRRSGSKLGHVSRTLRSDLSEKDRNGQEEDPNEGPTSESDSSVDQPAPKKRVRYQPRSPHLEVFLSICPPARDIQTEIDEVKKRGVVSLPSPQIPFDSLRGLLTVLFAYSQQRNYSISRRLPQLKDGVGAALVMKCYRNNTRYNTEPNGGRCKFELHGSKTEDGNWRFDKVVGSHNHPVLELTEGDDQLREENERAKEGSGQVTKEAKLDSTKFQPFALPAPRLPLASSSTLPSITSASIMAPPPPRPVTTTSTSTASALSYPLDLVSFLRAFDSSPSNFAHTLITLRSSGINDLDTLIGILAMEEENLMRFVEMLSDELVGKRIVEMAADLRERAV